MTPNRLDPFGGPEEDQLPGHDEEEVDPIDRYHEDQQEFDPIDFSEFEEEEEEILDHEENEGQ